MKNDNFFSKTFNSKKTIKSYYIKNQKYELTSTNEYKNYNSLFHNNNYLLEKKILFNPDDFKIKESIFKNFKDVPKHQIVKDKYILKRNCDKLLESFSVLKKATIDEGIMLNKYFEYLNNFDKEYRKLMEIKIKKMLISIMKEEKDIKKMKKKLILLQSFSNRMMMKYMVKDKEEFNHYLTEVTKNENQKSKSKSNKNKPRKCRTYNSLNFNNRKINRKLGLKNNKSKNDFLNYSYKTININYSSKRELMDIEDKKNIPKLNLENNENNKNIYEKNKYNTSVSSHSRNKKKKILRSRPLTAVTSYKYSINNINKKFYTPPLIKRIFKLNSSKNTIKTNYSSKKVNEIKNSDSFFKKTKINVLNNLSLI